MIPTWCASVHVLCLHVSAAVCMLVLFSVGSVCCTTGTMRLYAQRLTAVLEVLGWGMYAAQDLPVIHG
jgi:hypothetical protein